MVPRLRASFGFGGCSIYGAAAQSLEFAGESRSRHIENIKLLRHQEFPRNLLSISIYGAHGTIVMSLEFIPGIPFIVHMVQS